jgi:hypothetical protein
MSPFEVTFDRPSPEKLNPQNHTRYTINPFERESSPGISFNRSGGEEYSQARKTRHTTATVLLRCLISSDTPEIKIVDTIAEM